MFQHSHRRDIVRLVRSLVVDAGELFFDLFGNLLFDGFALICRHALEGIFAEAHLVEDWARIRSPDVMLA